MSQEMPDEDRFEGQTSVREWSRGRVGTSDAGLPLTDLGNAERMVRRFGKVIRYCIPRKCWFIWNGKRWAIDRKGKINRLAKRVIRAGYSEAENALSEGEAKAIAKHFSKSEDVGRLAAMITLASTEGGIAILPDQLDANPWFLNCENGTIDLKAGRLLPHDPKNLITRITPIPYEPGAKLQLWDEFLESATGGDAQFRHFLQRMAGYFATGSTQEKHFFFIYSKKPDTGKSTFCDAIRAALGEYAETADFETWLEQSSIGGNRGDLVRLAGSRVAISSEVRKRAKFDARTVKAITGGDPLTFAAKYEKEVTFKPGFKILLAANSAPVIADDDRPLFERCLRCPFEVQISPERKDAAVKERLSDPSIAGPALLAWIVAGCLEWQKIGLQVPEAVRRSSGDYASEMDRLMGFLAEKCVRHSGSRVGLADLSDAYEDWCAVAGTHPLGRKGLSERLRGEGFKQGKSGTFRYWQGLQLLDKLDDLGQLDAVSPELSHETDLGMLSGKTRPKRPMCPTALLGSDK